MNQINWKLKIIKTNLIATKMYGSNWLRVGNSMDQIDCYQNVTTKLIVRTKIGIFAYY